MEKKIKDMENCKIPYLSEKEIFDLFSSISDNRDYILIRLLYELGCSIKELLHIRIRDVDLENNTIIIKSSARKERVSVFSPRLKEIIVGYLEDYGLKDKRVAYLFTSSHGGMLTERRVNQIITKYLIDNKYLDFAYPQTIKYSHIINAYIKKVPMHIIQKQTGLSRLRLNQLISGIELSEDKSQYNKFFGNE
jgi:integrase